MNEQVRSRGQLEGDEVMACAAMKQKQSCGRVSRRRDELEDKQIIELREFTCRCLRYKYGPLAASRFNENINTHTFE